MFVTGSNGFIGKPLSKHLANCGCCVVPGYRNEETKLDITDMKQLISLEEIPNAVIHLAAKSSVNASLQSPYQTYFTNLLGTLNLLEFARVNNVKKFVNVSTYVYGQPQYVPVDEKHPARPHSLYHQSKMVAEQLCENYSYNFGIDIVTLRPFYVYGPGCRPYSFIPSIIRQIEENGKVVLSGENTRRDFLFIDDFVRLIPLILQKFPKGYNVYNVGYGEGHTLREVTEFIAKILKQKIIIDCDARIRPGDVTDMVADIKKVSTAFNWKPSVDWKEGLELTAKNSKV